MKFEEELLKSLINIPSVSGDEEKIANYICDFLKKEGFGVSKVSVDEKRFNIVAKLGKPKVYLQAHMDTVPPFIAYSQDSENIYGRGACDTKGSIAGMITAAINSKKGGKTNFGLIFTTGEETMFDGAKKIVQSNLDISFVVVGEPTSLDVVSAHFGILTFKINAKGKSAHSSKPEEGINAIELLTKAIEKIGKIRIYPETILTLAQIQGGVADNIIPGEAQAIYSMRVSPSDKENYIEKISRVLPERVEIEEGLNLPSVLTNVPTSLSFIKKRRTVKYSTELSFFQKGVIIGPGDIIYAHGPDERLPRKELSRSVEIYSQIIDNFSKT